MRCASIAVFVAVVIALPGCSYCENGLCSPGEPESIFDPALVGEWVQAQPEPEKAKEAYFKVERDSVTSNAYRITVIPLGAEAKRGEQPFLIKAYLTKFGDARFLDVPAPPDPERPDERRHHFILRVEAKVVELAFDGLNVDFIKGNPNFLRHTVERNLFGVESVRVTASTAELVNYVRARAHDEGAWTERAVFRRR